MKKTVLATFVVSACLTTGCATSKHTSADNQNATAQENTMHQHKEASYIVVKALPGKEKELADFLVAGAAIVKDTEPNTLLWSAVQLDKSTFAIFDTYPNKEGRNTHFSGQVAAALSQNAANLIEGGWEDGVLKNVSNPKILGAKVAPTLPAKMEKAMFIRIKAAPGKAEELGKFLTAGAAMIEESEPKTLYWYALQLDDDTFGIFDFFGDQSGIDAHFGGDVAAALADKAPELVDGGWEDGVVKNVNQFDVLTVITQEEG